MWRQMDRKQDNKSIFGFSLTGGSLCGNIRDNWSSTKKKEKKLKKSTYASKNVLPFLDECQSDTRKNRVRSNLNVALSVAFE